MVLTRMPEARGRGRPAGSCRRRRPSTTSRRPGRSGRRTRRRLVMLTIAPRSPLSVGSFWLIAVAARRMQLKVPTRLISSTFLYASRSWAEAYWPSLPMVRVAQPMPAELTRARSGPARSAVSTASMTWSVLVTSTVTNTPPISWRVPRPSRPACRRRRPWRPWRPAAGGGRPRPDAPPVTIALAPLISTSTD